MTEKIAVILVNFNGKKYNKTCIESILNSTVREKITIVVVDNASTDGSLEELRQYEAENPQLHLIQLDDNYGFSKGNNEGIRWAMEQGCDYFLLLNNDTEILPDAIEKLLVYQKENGGIVVPKILYADSPDVIWFAGGKFTKIIKKPVQIGLNQKDIGQYDRNRVCDFANGCCMLLDRQVIQTLGYLDERFFLYYEDTEYSFRAGRRGIVIWYCADAVIYHKVNGSTKGNERPASVYYITRNWLVCNRTYLKSRFPVFLVYFMCNRAAWALIWLIQGKPEMIRAELRGISDYYRKNYGR